MRITLIPAFLTCFLAIAPIAAFAEPPATTLAALPASRPVGTMTPLSMFTAKDLPEPQPGKPALIRGNQWSYNLALYGKWLYVDSDAEYILQFAVDPATAKLQYVGATPFAGHDPERGFGVNIFFVRTDAAGKPILYEENGGDAPPVLAWYEIDPQTGKLTVRGHQSPATMPIGMLLTPDNNRTYFIRGARANSKIVWTHFQPDGTSVEEGGAPCKDIGHYGQMMLSPDGRNLYTLSDPSVRLDVYSLDAKTGAPTFISSLDLEPTLQRVSGMMLISPDGKHLYIFNKWAQDTPGDLYCILDRDPATGAVKLASSGKADPALYGLGGPAWSRQMRFAFNDDGKSGCFIAVNGYHHRPTDFGTFTRDPATGAITVTAVANARGPGGAMSTCRLLLDPATGNLFTCGDAICSFKDPAR